MPSGRPTAARFAAYTVAAASAAATAWYVYDEYDLFAARVATGLVVATYGFWIADGNVVPRFGLWVELPIFIVAAWLTAKLLVDPPEKGGASLRFLWTLGRHPKYKDPNHPAHTLPGLQETVCHVLGWLISIVNALVITIKIVWSPGAPKKKKQS
ncbi:hypothetical protein DIPPA_17934 [Diplonema papillatum]|nr:hypothetical protein DIPPA_17934 [Diplonema papillatum]